jgi:type IV secretion system protein TrbL
VGGTGVIDQFLETFTRYIDSGFGLLGGEVSYLAATLAAIDVTLAGLFWSWGGDEDILARLVRKTLFVGVFAFLIGNWNSLTRVIFESFAGLGLKASGTGLSSADFLRPGKIAQVGLDAGRPILDSISGLMGYVSFFENFVQIAVLLFAWIVVLLAFFILAIQLFITLIEFKLTTLAGFVLIPFGLFGKTAFAAERVLGNVISSGVKVLVLAVIVGIGSTLFAQLRPALAAISRRSTMPWRSYSARCRFLASAFLVQALLMGLYPADRNLALALRLAPASRLVAPSSLAWVSQPAAPG